MVTYISAYWMAVANLFWQIARYINTLFDLFYMFSILYSEYKNNVNIGR